MSGKRWSICDRHSNPIYLTEERWKHIVEPINHPEMLGYEEELKETIQSGIRRQDSLNPQKYRYSQPFDNLVEDNTHIVAIVLFRFREDVAGKPEVNNYVVTAYLKEIG